MEEITADDADVLCYLFYSILFKDFFVDIFSANFTLWNVLVTEHSECV